MVVRVAETTEFGPSVTPCNTEELSELDDCEISGSVIGDERDEEIAEFDEDGEIEEENVGFEDEGEIEDELGLVGFEEGKDGERTEVGNDRELTGGTIDARGELADDAVIEVSVAVMPLVEMVIGWGVNENAPVVVVVTVMLATGVTVCCTGFSPPGLHVGSPTILINDCSALKAKFAGAVPVGTGTDTAGMTGIGGSETTKQAPLVRIVEVTEYAVNTL